MPDVLPLEVNVGKRFSPDGPPWVAATICPVMGLSVAISGGRTGFELIRARVNREGLRR